MVSQPRLADLKDASPDQACMSKEASAQSTWKYLEAYCFRSSLAHLQSGLKHMSTPLEKLEQQYAAEVVKVDADEGLLKRLERGIRGLKGVAESTGAWEPDDLKHILKQLTDVMQDNMRLAGLANWVAEGHGLQAA
ncbi:hypothetical protein WJX77_007584 [Trebouxia sp. C0004]